MIIKFDYLTNLPNLQSFETGEASFFETTSLSLSSMIIKFDYFTFSNLPNLQSFETGEGSFFETTSLSLSSNSIQFYFSLYLPKLQSFKTGYRSFHETTSLSLSSRIFLFLFMLMFLSQMENSIPCYSEIRMLMILNVMKVL